MNIIEQEKQRGREIKTDANMEESDSDIVDITRNWIEEQFHDNSEKTNETPAASDIFASCFLFAATGIKLPENDRDKVAFISGFLISGAASGGERSQGNPMSISSVAQISAIEAKRYHDNYLKDQIIDGKYSIDNIEEIDEEKDSAETIDSKIKDFLINQKINSSEIGLVKNEILKAVSIKLLSEAEKDNPDTFKKAEECLNNGETGKGIEIILNLVNFSIESPTLDQIIESTCNDWLAKNSIFISKN